MDGTTTDSSGLPAAVLDALRAYGTEHRGSVITSLASDPLEWLVSETAVAEVLLGCHPRTVRRMVRRGDLPPATPMGRHRVWRLGVVRARLQAIGEGGAR